MMNPSQIPIGDRTFIRQLIVSLAANPNIAKDSIAKVAVEIYVHAREKGLI